LVTADATAVPVVVGAAVVAVADAVALADVDEVSLLSEPHPPSSNAEAATTGIRLAHRTILVVIVAPRSLDGVDLPVRVRERQPTSR
jgi:hypothetical protein